MMSARRPKNPRVRLAMIAMLAGAVVASCAMPGASSSREPIGERSISVVIGAFNFSESQVLAEIYRQALDAAGIPAEVIGHVASREIMEPALEQGEVDLVPEYLGTALTFIDGPQEFSDDRAAWRRLHAAFAARGVSVLDAAPGQNRNEIVVTRDLADLHSLKKISDLESIAGRLTFGGPPECPARPLCLQGLENLYGLRFGDFLPLDTGGPMTVAALEGREVDVALLFTTSPALADPRFVALRDDRHLQPPEHVVPVVRDAVVERYGTDFTDVVNAVSAGLTDHSLRVLNRHAEVHKEPIPATVRRWLRARGLS